MSGLPRNAGHRLHAGRLHALLDPGTGELLELRDQRSQRSVIGPGRSVQSPLFELRMLSTSALQGKLPAEIDRVLVPGAVEAVEPPPAGALGGQAGFTLRFRDAVDRLGHRWPVRSTVNVESGALHPELGCDPDVSVWRITLRN